MSRPRGAVRGRPRDRARRVLTSDDGLVVAELAISLPAVVIMVGFVLGCAGVGAQQVRVQDAAADVARLLGRGDTEAETLAFVGRAAPAATLSVERDGGLVCVELRAPAQVIVTLPLVQVRGTACALDDRVALGD